jgi:hypothetical protein
MGEWPRDESALEPWVSFIRARHAFAAADHGTAIDIWRQIVARPGLEARDYLQAWHFLRQSGIRPGRLERIPRRRGPTRPCRGSEAGPVCPCSCLLSGFRSVIRLGREVLHPLDDCGAILVTNERFPVGHKYRRGV